MGGFSGASVPGELSAYVALADPTFEWTVRAQATGSVTFRLTSQTWRGVPWVHSLNLISYPNGSDTAILYLTGGDPNPLDDADAAIVAAESGLPTAMMFNVPTQPIFGKEEDALIAHTRKNAYLVFQEDNLGSIQAGKLADLVVLDRDYLTVPADQIRNIKPVMTMMGGRIVYDASVSTQAAR